MGRCGVGFGPLRADSHMEYCTRVVHLIWRPTRIRKPISRNFLRKREIYGIADNRKDNPHGDLNAVTLCGFDFPFLFSGLGALERFN
jgi:hypothetical protein